MRERGREKVRKNRERSERERLPSDSRLIWRESDTERERGR